MLWQWLILSPVWGAEVDLRIVAADFDLSAQTDRSLRRILHRMFRTYQDTFGLSFEDPTPVHIRLYAEREAYQREARALGSVRPPTDSSPRPWAKVSSGATPTTPRCMPPSCTRRATTSWPEVGSWWRRDGCMKAWPSCSSRRGYPARRCTSIRRRHGALAAAKRLERAAFGGVIAPALRVVVAAVDAERSGGLRGRVERVRVLMSTSSGKQTLAQLMRAGTDPEALREALDGYPGGADGLDRTWRAWVAEPIDALQLPIPTSGGGDAAGWIRCDDGRLIREGAGLSCAGWGNSR